MDHDDWPDAPWLPWTMMASLMLSEYHGPWWSAGAPWLPWTMMAGPHPYWLPLTMMARLILPDYHGPWWPTWCYLSTTCGTWSAWCSLITMDHDGWPDARSLPWTMMAGLMLSHYHGPWWPAWCYLSTTCAMMWDMICLMLAALSSVNIKTNLS